MYKPWNKRFAFRWSELERFWMNPDVGDVHEPKCYSDGWKEHISVWAISPIKSIDNDFTTEVSPLRFLYWDASVLFDHRIALLCWLQIAFLSLYLLYFLNDDWFISFTLKKSLTFKMNKTRFDSLLFWLPTLLTYLNICPGFPPTAVGVSGWRRGSDVMNGRWNEAGHSGLAQSVQSLHRLHQKILPWFNINQFAETGVFICSFMFHDNVSKDKQ